MRVLIALAIALSASCGARSTLDQPAAFALVAPRALHGKDDQGCPSTLPITDAREQMKSKQFGEAIAVVELFYQDECTGAGGQYILAREVDGFRSFWIGSHGCRSLPDPMPAGPKYGVLRYNQTAALFRIDDHVCIGFPDRPPGAITDVTTRAIAVFETLAHARAFAASL